MNLTPTEGLIYVCVCRQGTSGVHPRVSYVDIAIDVIGGGRGSCVGVPPRWFVFHSSIWRSVVFVFCFILIELSCIASPLY